MLKNREGLGTRLGFILLLMILSSSSFLQVLSHFIDCVFDGSEKDKVISLLKSVMYNVWPHLHNHRLVNLAFYVSGKVLEVQVDVVQMFRAICTTPGW